MVSHKWNGASLHVPKITRNINVDNSTLDQSPRYALEIGLVMIDQTEVNTRTRDNPPSTKYLIHVMYSRTCNSRPNNRFKCVQQTDIKQRNQLKIYYICSHLQIATAYMYTMCVYTYMYHVTCIPASIWVPRCLHGPFLAKQRAQKKQHNTHCTAQIEDRRADQNTRMLRRAWLLNRLPFDARLVQSLNVKHTSIKMANTFPNRSLFYSYHHLALRTLLLRTASHCCGRWVRASKQAIQLKAWV